MGNDTTADSVISVAVLEEDTPEHRTLVANELKRLNKEERFDYIRMWRAAGLDREPRTSTRISRFIARPTGRGGLTTQEVTALARWIWDKKPGARPSSVAAADALYFAMVKFLDIKRWSEQNFANETPGRYKMYRPAMVLPGHFVEGYVKVWLDKKSNAIKTYEFQRYAPTRKSGERTEIHEGYLFRKSDHIFIVSCQKGLKKLQVIHFTGEERAHSAGADGPTSIVQVLTGAVFGWYQDKLFTLPVYLQRVSTSERQLISQSGIRKREEIDDPAVLAFLDSYPTLFGLHLGRFEMSGANGKR